MFWYIGIPQQEREHFPIPGPGEIPEKKHPSGILSAVAGLRVPQAQGRADGQTWRREASAASGTAVPWNLAGPIRAGSDAFGRNR